MAFSRTFKPFKQGQSLFKQQHCFPSAPILQAPAKRMYGEQHDEQHASLNSKSKFLYSYFFRGAFSQNGKSKNASLLLLFSRSFNWLSTLSVSLSASSRSYNLKPFKQGQSLFKQQHCFPSVPIMQAPAKRMYGEQHDEQQASLNGKSKFLYSYFFRGAFAGFQFSSLLCRHPFKIYEGR